MGLFGRRKRLSELHRPERAHATGVVTSPNDLTSPLTGLRAAAFHVALYERYTVDSGGHGESGVVHLDPIGALTFGQAILLVTEDEGLLVEVPLEGARFSFQSADRNAQPLERVPAELAAIAARARPRLLPRVADRPR